MPQLPMRPILIPWCRALPRPRTAVVSAGEVAQRRRRRLRRESGQAAVEAALVLPLTLFIILGTIQLFMMLQARIMAEHAAFKAVRVGVVTHGDCEKMTHAALAALMPAIHPGFLGAGNARGNTPAEKLAQAWRLRSNNQYANEGEGPLNGPIVWLFRESPLQAQVNADSEENFDDPNFSATPGTQGYKLDVRLVFWFPMRVPFANWVMTAMFRAHFGIQQRLQQLNPLMPTAQSNWRAGTARLPDALVNQEYANRTGQGQFVFPIRASYGMRMMTPPRPSKFVTQNCPALGLP